MNRTNFRNACRARALGPAAAIAMLTGVANAQFVVERTFDPQPDAPHADHADEQVIVMVENDKKTELRLENGKVVRAVVDGETWPADRVTHKDGKVFLTGPDGKVVRTIVVRTPAAAPVPPTAPSAMKPGAPEAPMRWVVRTDKAPKPKVMLGINLSDPGEALRAHLGLGDAPAILIEGVIDGLPAAEAGLKKHDIVVSINGSDGASGQALSEVLAKAEPGETMTLKVRRSGEWKTVKVELAEYDAARLGVPTPPMPPSPMGFTDRPAGEMRFASPDGDLEVIIERLAESPDDPALLDELRRATTERARGLAREMQGQAEELSRGLNAERMAELERIRDEAQRRFEDVMRDTRNQFVELRDGRLFVRSADEAADRLDALRREVERRGPEVQQQLDDRLRAMEERLESVERRLTERMERLAVLLERVAERAEADRKD